LKHLVLDTNVLLHDPKCLENFGDNYVYIPLACIEELDHHKSRQDDVGRNAREVARQLDAYREIGTLSEGVDTSKGGKIFITPKSAQTKKSVHIPAELDLNKVDNQIIEFALSLSQKEGVEDVKVISKDINVRLKCDSLKICSEDYYALRAKSNTDEVYGGVVRLAHDDIQEIYDNSELDVFKSSENFSVAPNTFVVVKNYTTNQSVIVRVLNPELGSYKIIKNADSPMGIKHKNKEQMMALDLLMDPSVHLVTLVGLAGSGKAQPLDAKILTPNGWTTMGNIKVGDFVIGRNGKPTKVNGVFPQGEKDIYKVTMSDGASTECCEEHLWLTHTSIERDTKKSGKIRNLKEIKESLITKNKKRNHMIPMSSPVEFEERKLDIDPYVLGALLGDGSLSTKGRISFTSADEEMILKISEKILKNNACLKPTKQSSDKIRYDYRINRVDKAKFGIFEIIKSLELNEHLSQEKFIPEKYLINSVQNRIELLRGLMDTDGFISADGMSVSFYSTSKNLSEGVKFLVQSLGGKAVIGNKQTSFTYKNVKKNGQNSYVVQISMPPEICPFSLARKVSRYVPRTKYVPRRYFDKVEFVGKKQAQCISVEDKEHLYITDDFIVTHNTLLAVAAGLEQVLIKKNYEKLVITRPIEPVGKDIGFLPGPQPLDAKIATPQGWTTMGELKIGSEIFSETGVPTKVIGIYPKGVKDVYRIKTSDGKTTECCEDHLWLTQTKSEFKHSKSGSVKTTRQIMDTLLVNGKENHYLPMNGVVQYKEQKIEIDPYTMGTILGDGSIVDNVLLVSKDEEIIENSSNGFNTTKTNVNGMSICNFVTKPYNNKAGRKVKITNVATDKFKIFDSVGIAHKEVGNGIHKATFQTRCTNKTVVDGIKYEFLEKTSKWQNNLKQKFCDYNLLGKKSFDKFIPDAYKYNTVDVRIGIIRGLMDTDGTVKKTGEASFCTTSKQLAEDIIEIVRSLGGRANISSRDRVGKQSKFNNRTITSKRISYEFVISLPETLNPFLLKRKAERYSKKYIHSPRIVSIEPIGKKEVQCILVENESHLYLTDDFIVTHNTMQEKMAPWVAPIRDNLDYIFSNKVGKKDTKDLKDQKSSRQPRRDGDPEPFSKNPHTAMMVENGTIEIEAVTYIRGRSIPRAFLIIDEAQNLSLHQLKTIITRAGEGTKIVLTGDLTQIDVHTLDELSSGLTHGVEKFKESFISGHITLKKGERSALATLAADLL